MEWMFWGCAVGIFVVTAVGEGYVAHAKLVIHPQDAGTVANLMQAFDANEAGYRVGVREIRPYLVRGGDEA